MAHAYIPGLRVASRSVIRKIRKLPLAGEVVVETGQAVKPDTVVAQTHLPGPVHNVNVANALGVAPEDVPRLMLKQVGDPVGADEWLAQSKGIFGLFKSAVKAPVAGTVELISDVTGQVLVREPPVPVRVQAHIQGRVVSVFQGEGVEVETVGALIQGIFGIGGEAHAPLLLIADDPDATITADMITESCRGHILCGGAMITLDALRRLKAVDAVGVVTGGIQYHDVGELLGYQIGVAVTGGEDIGLTVIATEGFGRMRMADRTFDLLKFCQGQHASISGATQIRAGVIRPEVIIPQDGTDPSDLPEETAHPGLTSGSLVRIIRNPYFGQIGTVCALPEQPQSLPTEASVRVVEVRLTPDVTVIVPRANVELVAS